MVRKAVSRLKSLGQVETRRGSGAFVKAVGFSPLQFDAGPAVSKRAVIEMVEVRRGLGARAAEETAAANWP